MKTQLKAILLPLLAAAYPLIYLYSLNAQSLTTSSLKLPLSAALLAAASAYALFWLLLRRPLAASLAATVFVVFFHLYGYLYRWLVKLDVTTVEHYLLLPLVLYLLGYAVFFLAKLKPAAVEGAQKILLLVATVLVTVNLVMAVPVEAQKASAAADDGRSMEGLIPVASPRAEGEKPYPDIYYIVFDEYAGFNAIREYWKDDTIDEFEEYLQQNGFYIADESRSHTLSTVIELASRLDLWPYPDKTDSRIVVQAVRQNRVMQILESYGYTTVALDMAFQGVQADISTQYDVSQIGGMAVDEFQKKFMDDSMLLPFKRIFMDNDPSAEEQREIIFEILEKTANPPSEDAPKFVYTHILLPHKPFIFDEDGNFLDPAYRDDWHAYLGQHKYATTLARQLIDEILAQADPNNPPVIIFQSDHGARNINHRTRDDERLMLAGFLEDYSLDYAYDIVNALYLPGFDKNQLNKAMDPVDTFVLVLNHYLDAEIKIEDPGRR